MLSDRKWKLDSVTALVAGILLCVSGGGIVMMGLKHLAPALRVTEESFYTFIIGTLSFHGMTLVLTHVFLRHHQMTWSEFLGGDRPGLGRILLLATAVALLALPVGIFLNTLSEHVITLLHGKPATPPNIKIFEVSAGLSQRLAFAFAAIVIAPLVEEVLFRGILYPAIKSRGHPRAALLGTALLFASIHGSLLNFVPLFGLAIIFTQLYDRTDCLLAPILAHSLFNAANMAVFLQPELSHWLDRSLEQLP